MFLLSLHVPVITRWRLFACKGFGMKQLLNEKLLLVHPVDVRDPHRQASALSDIILGGQDGLVNVLGVVLGVAAATSDPHIVLVAGLAATFAESVSMGAVAYTSTMADADFYESEREREHRHIREMPHLERDEILHLQLCSRTPGHGDGTQ